MFICELSGYGFESICSHLQNVLKPNHGWGKVKEVTRSYLNVPLFLDFKPPFLATWFGRPVMLCEKVKQYPALYDK